MPKFGNAESFFGNAKYLQKFRFLFHARHHFFYKHFIHFKLSSLKLQPFFYILRKFVIINQY